MTDVAGLLALWRDEQPDLQRTADSTGMCVIASNFLATWLTERDIANFPVRATAVGGDHDRDEHWAVMLLASNDQPTADSIVIDPTARQFDPDIDSPWYGTASEWAALTRDWQDATASEVAMFRTDPEADDATPDWTFTSETRA